MAKSLAVSPSGKSAPTEPVVSREKKAPSFPPPNRSLFSPTGPITSAATRKFHADLPTVGKALHPFTYGKPPVGAPEATPASNAQDAVRALRRDLLSDITSYKRRADVGIMLGGRRATTEKKIIAMFSPR